MDMVLLPNAHDCVLKSELKLANCRKNIYLVLSKVKILSLGACPVL